MFIIEILFKIATLTENCQKGKHFQTPRSSGENFERKELDHQKEQLMMKIKTLSLRIKEIE